MYVFVYKCLDRYRDEVNKWFSLSFWMSSTNEDGSFLLVVVSDSVAYSLVIMIHLFRWLI